MITPNLTKAVKVRFLKSFFEDDFPETGMVAWLTHIEWDGKRPLWSDKSDCYKLYFDFSEFEAENAKYFIEAYFPNKHVKELEASTGRTLFTALEAGMYTPKYSVYYSVPDNSSFEMDILNYLEPIVDVDNSELIEMLKIARNALATTCNFHNITSKIDDLLVKLGK